MNLNMNRTITRRGFLENAMLAAADNAGDQMLVGILDPSKVLPRPAAVVEGGAKQSFISGHP